MELTLKEAALILHRPVRTLRAQVARGQIPGYRHPDGQWRVPRDGLPLTEAQRQALSTRAEFIRQAVDDALPSRLPASGGRDARTHRSVVDTAVVREALALRGEMTRRAAADEDGSVACARRALDGALLALSEALHHFDRAWKLDALLRARTRLALAAGHLLLGSGIPVPEPQARWIATLEGALIPEVAAMTRRLEGGTWRASR